MERNNCRPKLLMMLMLASFIIFCRSTESIPGATDYGGKAVRVKRLIGGSSYEKGKWPWLVSLQGKIPSKTFLGIPLTYQRFYCGASLLKNSWILTAAHCLLEHDLGSKALEPKYWHAKLGQIELKSSAIKRLKGFLGRILKIDKLRNSHLYLHATKIVIHPNYNKTRKWEHDIALLKLEDGVPSDDDVLPHIRSVRLINHDNLTFPSVSTNCIMMGWGCTTTGGPVVGTAHEVNMPIVRDEQCSVHWGISPVFRLCAGRHLTNNLGICSGDSGGPLVCEDGDNWLQVGIASFTSATRPGDVPGVFTRVSKYIDWIQDVIRL